MSNLKLNEIVNTVDTINEKIFDILEKECKEYFSAGLTVSTDTYVIIVEFMGNRIWNSDDDERVETSDDVYEPLYNFLVRKIKYICKSMNLVQKKI